MSDKHEPNVNTHVQATADLAKSRAHYLETTTTTTTRSLTVGPDREIMERGMPTPAASPEPAPPLALPVQVDNIRPLL